jgi:hypothetical protein
VAPPKPEAPKDLTTPPATGARSIVLPLVVVALVIGLLVLGGLLYAR